MKTSYTYRLSPEPVYLVNICNLLEGVMLIHRTEKYQVCTNTPQPQRPSSWFSQPLYSSPSQMQALLTEWVCLWEFSSEQSVAFIRGVPPGGSLGVKTASDRFRALSPPQEWMSRVGAPRPLIALFLWGASPKQVAPAQPGFMGMRSDETPRLGKTECKYWTTTSRRNMNTFYKTNRPSAKTKFRL